ncbi:hypothetical protein HYC85_028267 [Camellia sinensis]|uniref:Protein root UVB sensitive/RUS domain-containing protein n=1 Tax=Camellia sinensis TaxID=4442 RepID=A0A7J7FYM7_CAMSI|nr:hypothetical protein HYC85_028267 [Camellia sinensis]
MGMDRRSPFPVAFFWQIFKKKKTQKREEGEKEGGRREEEEEGKGRTGGGHKYRGGGGGGGDGSEAEVTAVAGAATRWSCCDLRRLQRRLRRWRGTRTASSQPPPPPPSSLLPPSPSSSPSSVFSASCLRNFFLPREVSENYLEYVKWKFLHRFFSYALQVLATQAMFQAIGIGYSRSLPSAAALNWVLKDGLGRLSRCIYTASLASSFDTNLNLGFQHPVLFSLSIGVELLTPTFPQYLLLVASIANIAKQISLACCLATGTAVHRSFAVADNLGEVSAKAQIQTVCFDSLGLMLAAALNILFRNNLRFQASLPFVVYPIFLAIDLIGIYQGLKHVHLQKSPNKTRTYRNLNCDARSSEDSLARARNQKRVFSISGFARATQASLKRTFISFSWDVCIPSPADVSEEEGIDFMWNKGRGSWPIRIGCLNPKSQLPRLLMMTMQSLNNEDFYFICLEILCSGMAKTWQQGILHCVREGAGTADIIMGLLQACHIRKAILSSVCKWESILEAPDNSDSVSRHWFQLIEDSK